MKKELLQLFEQAREEFKNTASSDTKAQEQWRSLYLGRKGKISEMAKHMKDLSSAEKKEIGKIFNEGKKELEQLLGGEVGAQKEVAIDMTIPGVAPAIGHVHPITQVMDTVVELFVGMGFDVAEGPEVELSKYNFDLLNIPKDHPSRDMWDTFYVNHGSSSEDVVMRTHTSPVQLRAMEDKEPPVRLIVPGRVFRNEATDASHETNFYQIEGLVIDKGIGVPDLVGVLQAAMKGLYGDDTEIRLRPSFFPFVEPGFEIDVSCKLWEAKTNGKKWLEILGAGMVHPTVLKNMGVDPNEYTGFAFGMGLDRLMMLNHGVDDIRLSYTGGLPFVRQF
ncbi:MAG: phenylalanine--tRNA ligase subunit alpha [Candidatus Jacksonbacteria bacterium]|jgi:phenylalanyl-tRNA synthetase alpha chain|nr:phenylalanine--tRNA ligase subunit alpha [Candidatus Jacksonbacteria bacterium]MBT6034487.1 phenylalanine--tRNA ligase subunit alpha [Candidatus Jacksonbacteria bacterium]MBT6301393.1 phenylalanine--tRNA ligase subunit alpha [Candidatus Jacksonbacteria bacterium]MBT6757837.1 phenylalanine--tRNA ligase subunit alpha [Candidatus Jacksonbacteria bacterium]MBT6955375.1 phenylalanine--tRNA ligase subunit alpha [Candidatus Jacksonbacteria bacterium]